MKYNLVQEKKIKERNQEICRLHNEIGLTLREIGARYDICYERVRQIIQKGVCPVDNPNKTGT